MCYRIAKFLLIALAVFSFIALFVPWQTMLFLSDEQAAHFQAIKLVLLPVPAVFFWAAMWAGQHGQPRQPHRRHLRF